jgi:hypothetical protein
MTVAVGGTNMSHLPRLNSPVVRVAVCSALVVMILSAVSCGRKPNNTTVANTGKEAVGTTGKETQKTFASPAEA